MAIEERYINLKLETNTARISIFFHDSRDQLRQHKISISVKNYPLSLAQKLLSRQKRKKTVIVSSEISVTEISEEKSTVPILEKSIPTRSGWTKHIFITEIFVCPNGDNTLLFSSDDRSTKGSTILIKSFLSLYSSVSLPSDITISSKLF